jgi:transcriptional regulator with XRE-family HTH domain
MTESAELNRQIAQRVHELRTAKSLSLEALANRSGVSRSMISLIERAESSPTAVVLDKLAAALSVSLAALFDGPANGTNPGPKSPIARHSEQPSWQDPGSGYRRRSVTPAGVPQPMQISEVHFPAGARVAFETGVREVPVHQQVWVLDGEIEIAVGEDRHRLRKGDCLAMLLDGPTLFHNPTQKPARYAVVTSCENRSRRP